MQLDPRKWFKSGPQPLQTRPIPSLPVFQQQVLLPPKLKVTEDIPMSTAPVVQQHNGFVRFIDAVGHFFVRTAPVVEEVAVAAEPFLALTPFGPEYNLVVNAVVGVQKNATASIAAGVNLTNEQKFALAVQASQPGLNAILTSKGITDDTDAHINNWVQLIFNLLSGPVIPAVVAATKASSPVIQGQ
jgi:hypothetical protein